MQKQPPNIVQVLQYGQLNEDVAIYFIGMALCAITLKRDMRGEEIQGLVSWNDIREQNDIESYAYKMVIPSVVKLIRISAL